MSVSESSRPAPFGAIATHTAITWIDRRAAALRDVWADVRTEREIQRLDDRTRNDIGIQRRQTETIDGFVTARG